MSYTSLRSISRSSLVQSRMISSAPFSDCSSYNNPTWSEIANIDKQSGFHHSNLAPVICVLEVIYYRSQTCKRSCWKIRVEWRRTQNAGQASRKGRGPQSAPLISKYPLSLTCQQNTMTCIDSVLFLVPIMLMRDSDK